MDTPEFMEMTEREIKEIQHALYYALHLAHGTAGHNQLMLIARVATHMGFRLEGNTVIPPDYVRVLPTGQRLQ